MAKAYYTIELTIEDYNVPVSEEQMQMWLDGMCLENNVMPKRIHVEKKG